MLAFSTRGWDRFFAEWVMPTVQLLIPAVLALLILLALAGLITRWLVATKAQAWPPVLCWIWGVAGALAITAAAAFFSMFPMFEPFGPGLWLSWAGGVLCAAGGLLIAHAAGCLRWTSLPAGHQVMPVPSAVFCALAWAALFSCFYSWGSRHRLVVAEISLAMLGVVAIGLSLGQNLRLQVIVRNAHGTTDVAASEYVMARLQSLGSKPSASPDVARETDLSRLRSEDLSAIPAGAIAGTLAKIMYAVQPGLTWRANVTLVDPDRATVALTRNNRLVATTAVSRAALRLPGCPRDLAAPQLEHEQGRNRAQLLTATAAFVLVRLSQCHPQRLEPALCGAQRWKSVALQLIANEPALSGDDPALRVYLLRKAVNLDPGYGLARIAYLNELILGPTGPANRFRFARMLDQELQLTKREGDPQEGCKAGWEFPRLQICYSSTALRINGVLHELAEADGTLSPDGRSALLTAKARVATLKTDAKAIAQLPDGNNDTAKDFAVYLAPVAEGLSSAIDLLVQRCQLPDGQPENPPDVTPSSPDFQYQRACLAAVEYLEGGPNRQLGQLLDCLLYAGRPNSIVQRDVSFTQLLKQDPEGQQIRTTLGIDEHSSFTRYTHRLTEWWKQRCSS
ncbi:hypothetical protein GCM10010211_36910 [Streptomyces albospinus]|uniref:Transmembrane protein n=1 Tax=Streptomyces albospinus TaxID=285515 RepID=A0ABQ2V4N9_9ACTN|nr:hypothetical protein [Streptomyces albospinus]GGU68245.1 hypothetical protein GCM10010211_36910 [Streptomyces albospinus]